MRDVVTSKGELAHGTVEVQPSEDPRMCYWIAFGSSEHKFVNQF